MTAEENRIPSVSVITRMVPLMLSQIHSEVAFSQNIPNK